MTDNCNQTIPGDFEFSDQGAVREERLILNQYRELSRKHAAHGRSFSVTIVRSPDGTVSVFGGYPAGRVRDE